MNAISTSITLATTVLAACSAATTVPAAQPTPAANSAPVAVAVPVTPTTIADSSKVTAADIRFMTGMIGHHAQAIVMAKMAPSHGANSQIRTLAGRIINAQQDEIALMSQFLRDHKQPVPEPSADMHAMHDMGEHALMPGMLTHEQMMQLDAARGREFDELFLRFMIQHHQGAVTMVKDLFATNGAAQDDLVFKLASDVNVDQTTEIARMQRMLGDLIIGKDDQ